MTHARPLSTALLALLVTFSIGCGPYDPNFNGPYGGYNNGGYNNGGYYGDDWQRRRDIDRARDERRELEQERERAAEERRRLERERDRANNAGWNNPPPARPSPPAPSVDRCPPGFSPSERKCSSDERRRGCRDIRTPSGLGCVSR